MPILNQGKFNAEFLLHYDNKYSLDAVTLAAAASALSAGTLLGKIAATGKYVAYSNAAGDGSEVAVAILKDNVADSTADQKVVVVSRHAEVQASELTGLDTPARADLTALGIILR